MCLLHKHISALALVGALLLALSSCDKISIPRLGFEQEPETHVPIPVTYAFAQNLLDYSQTVQACGLPYTIPVGEIISQAFLRVGQERFDGVRAEPPVGQAQGAPLSGYRIILEINQFKFDPVTKIGEEDRYSAFVDLQLQAIYEDGEGTPVAQSPLTNHQKVSLWTPALSGQSTSCATAQIDQTVEDAAEILANDMANAMLRLPKISQSVSQSNPFAFQPGSSITPANSPKTSEASSSIGQSRSPSVQFRTKLVDANKNYILEGGEVMVLLIETTNASSVNIPSVYVELRGTNVLVEAFKRVVSLPVAIGPLNAGEKRTTEIRGRLGSVTEKLNGELIIGISLSEGIPPGTHTIRTEIQPGPTRKKTTL